MAARLLNSYIDKKLAISYKENMQKPKIKLNIKNHKIVIIIFSILFIYILPINIIAKDDLNCSLCHIYKELKITDNDGKTKSFYVNKNLFNSLIHAKLTCETCHYTIIQTPHLPENLKRINCQSKCHVNDPFIDKNFTHESVNIPFQKSAHGDRVENPLGCACHNKHLMAKVKEWAPQELNWVCAHNCHEDKLLMYKYKLFPNTISGYLESYHGEAIKFDEKKYPTCYTCHGNHDIKIKEEKESPTNQRNRLEKICGLKDCHKTGLEKKIFVQGTYHQIYKKEDIKKGNILNNIKNFYFYIILFTVILSCFFYILRFISKSRRKKIFFNILIVILITIVGFSPIILKLFIKEKGVRYGFTTTPDRYKSICLECHNLYPHHKNLIMRAFMNLHSKKLACEVCHVRSIAEIEAVKKEEERLEILKKKKTSKEKTPLEEEIKPLEITREQRGITYKWYKGGKELAKIIRKIDGEDGSQIMLFKVLDNNKFEILEAKRDTGIDPNFKVSPIAVQCKDCHNEKGLMDFRALGYPEKTIKETLEKNRAFEMLHKSEKFLIPKLF